MAPSESDEAAPKEEDAASKDEGLNVNALSEVTPVKATKPMDTSEEEASDKKDGPSSGEKRKAEAEEKMGEAKKQSTEGEASTEA